jgi:hypothetical protein
MYYLVTCLAGLILFAVKSRFHCFCGTHPFIVLRLHEKLRQDLELGLCYFTVSVI